MEKAQSNFLAEAGAHNVKNKDVYPRSGGREGLD